MYNIPLSKAQLKKAAYNLLPWKYWGHVYRAKNFKFGDAVNKFRKNRVGENSYIDPSVQIFGWENITIGKNTTISEDVWLNAIHKGGVGDRVVISDNCHIGRRNYFSAGPLIHIKDYTFTGVDCHLLGCGHCIDDPMIPYISSGITNGGKIEIGVNCWLTTSVTILQSVSIGCGSIIGTRAVVMDDIPPFSLVLGNPGRVAKRFDFKNNQWVRSSDWRDNLEEFMPSEESYLEHLKVKNNLVSMSLLAGSSKFGWL